MTTPTPNTPDTTDGPDRKNARRAELQFAALLLLLTTAAFMNAAHDAFVYDDKFFVPDGPLTLGGILRLFREDAWAATGTASDVYRPLLLLSIFVEGALHGLGPRWFHVTNIALHVTTTLVLFGLLLEVLRGRSSTSESESSSVRISAFFAALFFGLHPIHTEAVNSVFNRSEIMATLPVLAAIWIVLRDYQRHPVRTSIVASLLYFVALLCRESAAALPLLIFWTLAIVRPHLLWRESGERGLRGLIARIDLRLLAAAIPLFVVAVVYLWLRRQALTAQSDAIPGISIATNAQPYAERLGMVLTMLRQGLRLLFVPHPLRANYETLGSGGPLHALLIHALIVASALWTRRSLPGFLLGLGFYYVAMLPSTRLFGAGNFTVTLGERYLYLPSVGLSLGLALILPQLFALAPRRAVVAGLAVIAALFFIGTGARNVDWRSDMALWQAESRVAPDSGNTWRYLAGAYLDVGRPGEAVRICDEHLPRFRKLPKLQTHCAIAYEQLHRDREAEASYRAAIELGLGPVGHSNLGRFLWNTGRRAESEQAYLQAIAAEYLPARKHHRRGQFLRRFYPSRRDEAAAEFQRAVELQPRFGPARDALDDLRGVPSKKTPLDAR